MDFSHSSEADKRAFLERNAERDVVMDFSTLDPLPFYEEYPQLKGSFPGQFAIQGRCELHLREEIPGVIEAMQGQGLAPALTSIAGLGFTVPRTLAMIVNEAYFALEEKVASGPDIDRAMRFGVNYPAGPFEWASGREKLFVELLDELGRSSRDDRYLVCGTLRQASEK
jgi:3-hydroxybutyryl-CoA dehydrogenase